MQLHFKLEGIVAVIFIASILSSSVAGSAEIQTLQFPIHDVRNCPMQAQLDSGQSARVLDILPGMGFDNLRNVDMGQVHFHNYSLCKVTTDGRFVIPDSTFIIPIQKSHYKFSADYFDHWDNYSSITSSKVASSVGLFGILNGGFSTEKMSVKENQVNFKSKTTRVTFRNSVYTIRLDTSAEIHSTFKGKVYEIAACLQNNDTKMAYYLAELLVRDYGTHYITSVETGAVFAKLDYVSESYASHEEREKLAAAAAFSLPILQLFNSSFDLGFSYSYSSDRISKFFQNRKKSEMFTIGGAPFTPDLNLTKWILEVPNKMAIIDRTADPLFYVLTPSRFPELLPTTIMAVSDVVSTAIGWYYQLNLRPGCTNPSAKNFDFQANYGDSSYCNTSKTYKDMIFGGVYQKCFGQRGRENLCNPEHTQAAQVNPQTGGYSCPAGYTDIVLQTGSVSLSKKYQESKRSCKLFIFCKTRSYLVTGVSFATYETHWCVALSQLKQSMYRGYLFGGFFSLTNNNPLTASKSCPPYFRGQKIASSVTLCLSNDYELASTHSVKFGGFHSCKVGNPLAIPSNSNDTLFTSGARKHWPHSCPSGYSQHLVDVDNGCEIHVCLESGAFNPKHLLPPFLPPFHRQPPFVPQWTDKLAVVGADNTLLIRNTLGQWQAHSSDSEETKAFIETAMENLNLTEAPASPIVGVADAAAASGPTKWELVSLIMSTVAVATLICLVFMTSIITCKVCCKKRKKVKSVERGHVPLIAESLDSRQL